MKNSTLDGHQTPTCLTESCPHSSHLKTGYCSVNRGQESSMEKWWFNSMLSNEKLEYKCGLSKSTDSPDPIENTSGSKDRVINNTDKNINNWSQIKSSSCSNVDHLFGIRDIRNFISDDTLGMVRRDIFYITSLWKWKPKRTIYSREKREIFCSTTENYLILAVQRISTIHQNNHLWDLMIPKSRFILLTICIWSGI